MKVSRYFKPRKKKKLSRWDIYQKNAYFIKYSIITDLESAIASPPPVRHWPYFPGNKEVVEKLKFQNLQHHKPSK